MQHPLENLDPERFQMVCQALLVEAYPDVVLLPVGQPDGGRDAIEYEPDFDEEDVGTRPFKVFQIKFSRERRAGAEGLEWIKKTFSGELEKAKKLVEKGASEYVIVTNVTGSAHPDVGSIDRLVAWLQSQLNVPVRCWWRDDLDRRLDASWDIKLRYPELLTGQDFLRLLAEKDDIQGKEDRNRVLRAFLAAQYEDDAEVRFRQVELQNRLLDLFVDLPIASKESGGLVDEASRGGGGHRRLRISSSMVEIEDIGLDRETEAATFLLYDLPPPFSQAVVEGAPGQGKSTLAQYLCQVHRIRLLQKKSDLNCLPKSHQRAPLRVPFKVDLRDLAVWLEGGDPFSKDNKGAGITPKSLETFLAHLVQTQAGGIAFSVHDLLQVSKLAPMLIVLDGLDEVADTKQRSEVIQSISKALPRIRENCPDARVIITSRPAAFANSPGFDSKLFPHLVLGSLTRPQIDSYASKWISAKHLSSRDRETFRDILNDKLERPHMRDLARNPMQLAILLSLIHSEGPSLPDKRTSLYDEYVNRFFSRESVKNPYVNKHLRILKELHGYIAWYLHAQAELDPKKRAGRISTAELKSVLQDYLRGEEHPVELIDEIFGAMLERIVMLVPRMLGTYEFEVQPLREYFAGRYLYNAAAYSPVGRPKGGSRPDIFNAISKNLYWLNVTRFFCGCFTKGELLDLADRVIGLCGDAKFGRSRHPVTLAAMLLADFVFEQSPKATKQVLAAISRPDEVIKLTPAPATPHAESYHSVLFQLGGVDPLVPTFNRMLNGDYRSDRVGRLAWLVRANWPETVIDEKWLSAGSDLKEAGRLPWLRCGALLGSLRRVPLEELAQRLGTGPLPDIEAEVILRAGRPIAVTQGEGGSEQAFRLLLSVVGTGRLGVEPPFYLLTSILGAGALWSWSYGGGAVHHLSFVHQFEKSRQSVRVDKLTKSEAAAFEISCRLSDAFIGFGGGITTPRWLAAFDDLIERCRAVWGEMPAVFTAALVVASQGKSRKFDPANLLDQGTPLGSRLGYARSQARQSPWWLEQLDSAKSGDELSRVLQALFRLASPLVISDLARPVSRYLNNLDDEVWTQLFAQARWAVDERADAPRTRSLPAGIHLGDYSRRAAILTALATSREGSELIFMQKFRDDEEYNDCAEAAGSFRQSTAIRLALDNVIPWPEALKIVAQTYASGFVARGDWDWRASKLLPQGVAVEVADKQDSYPREVWEAAQFAISTGAGRSARKIMKVAEAEGWFQS